MQIEKARKEVQQQQQHILQLQLSLNLAAKNKPTGGAPSQPFTLPPPPRQIMQNPTTTSTFPNGAISNGIIDANSTSNVCQQQSSFPQPSVLKPAPPGSSTSCAAPAW
ncbi:unnamed protein product [Amoebophrya sp. A120]|nr:unnamed protein product [Amoebophrya sp. A120]|eukprot:GSA120T00023231001.1